MFTGHNSNQTASRRRQRVRPRVLAALVHRRLPPGVELSEAARERLHAVYAAWDDLLVQLGATSEWPPDASGRVRVTAITTPTLGDPAGELFAEPPAEVAARLLRETATLCGLTEREVQAFDVIEQLRTELEYRTYRIYAMRRLTDAQKRMYYSRPMSPSHLLQLLRSGERCRRSNGEPYFTLKGIVEDRRRYRREVERYKRDLGGSRPIDTSTFVWRALHERARLTARELRELEEALDAKAGRLQGLEERIAKAIQRRP
jgi:hypothetical protein